VCVFITAVPITKLLACGGGIWEDMYYERRRAEACVDEAAHHELVSAVRREVHAREDAELRAGRGRVQDEIGGDGGRGGVEEELGLRGPGRGGGVAEAWRTAWAARLAERAARRDALARAAVRTKMMSVMSVT
jgi:hypothetical protein